MKALAVALVSLALGLAAPARALVVSNGLAPPDHNVFEDLALNEHLVVRNVGCDVGFAPGGVPLPCPSPGGPTGASVDGGTMGIIYTTETSTVHLVDGEAAFVMALDGSSIVMDGGRTIGLAEFLVRGVVIAQDAASVLVQGGTLDRLAATGSGSLTVTGGSFSPILDPEALGHLVAEDQGQVFVVGSEFAIDGVPVGPGPISPNVGQLSGVFASGEPFLVEFFHTNDAAIFLVAPEPAALAFWAPALLALAALAARPRP